MSSEGKTILKSVKQIRRLCQDISLLLRTSDKIMEKANWKATSNNALAGISWSINYPEYWIPIYAYRFYKQDEPSNRLAYISVILDDHWEGEYTIEEPLISAGFFDFGATQVTTGGNRNWELRYARLFARLSKDNNWEPNGEIIDFERNMAPPDFEGEFEKGRIFALPLTSIKNEKDLATNVTGKLLKILKT